MEIFITLLTVLLIFCCVLMILIVLMQRPKQEGLGAAFGGGITDSLLGAGTTSFLQKLTVYLAVAFFLISTALAVMVSKKQRGEDAIGLSLEGAEKIEATDTPDNGGLTPTPPADLPGGTPEPVPAPETTTPEPETTTPEPEPETTTPEPEPETTPEPAPETAPEPAPETAPEPAPAEEGEQPQNN